MGLALRRLDGGADPIERLPEPLAADGLSQIVERVQLEGVDRGVVVRADEHELRRRAEAPQDTAELESTEVRHPHVEEDRVEAL